MDSILLALIIGGIIGFEFGAFTVIIWNGRGPWTGT